MFQVLSDGTGEQGPYLALIFSLPFISVQFQSTASTAFDHALNLFGAITVSCFLFDQFYGGDISIIMLLKGVGFKAGFYFSF